MKHLVALLCSTTLLAGCVTNGAPQDGRPSRMEEALPRMEAALRTPTPRVAVIPAAPAPAVLPVAPMADPKLVAALAGRHLSWWWQAPARPAALRRKMDRRPALEFRRAT